MPKFRKRPVVIEAIQWDGTFDGYHAVSALQTDRPITLHRERFGVDVLHISTLEGVMTATAGDWIIRGVKGEVYPCKPDIFAATYEEVS